MSQDWVVLRAAALLAVLAVAGCPTSEPPPDPVPPGAIDGVQVRFALGDDLSAPGAFYDAPWPSDLRRHPDGTVDVDGYPMPPDHARGGQLLAAARGAPGFSAFPTVRFRLDAPGPRLHPDDGPLPVTWDAPALLVRVDGPDAPALVPVVAQSLEVDDWTPSNVVAIQPAPGFVLQGGARHVAVLRRDLAEPPLGVPREVRLAVAADAFPELNAVHPEARDHFAPVRALVDGGFLDRDDIAAATVFTPRDVVAETAARQAAVRAQHTASIVDLALDPTDGADHARYCELRGTVALPQFQDGVPPFDEGGVWVEDADGPVAQRTDVAPVTITLPREPAPPGGYPVVVYLHGTSGSSREVVDRGPVAEEDGERAVGLGPAHVLAGRGIAAVGMAHLLVEERLGEAIDRPYLNLDNLTAYPGTWQQGMSDVRLLLDALETVDIPDEALAGCDGAEGGPLDLSRLVVMGQSAGAHLATEVAATDARPLAVVPTGSGGFWAELLAGGSRVGGPPELFALLLSTEVELTTLHPGLALLTAAWEPAEPMVFAPRVGVRPLDGLGPKHLYVPASLDDGFFPEPIYDAMAVAYGVERAGPTLWGAMDDGLALAGLRTDLAYPVEDNRETDGVPWTGVVVQWAGDGLWDSHSVFSQIPPLMQQYGCFVRRTIDGEAALTAPGSEEDDACD